MPVLLRQEKKSATKKKERGLQRSDFKLISAHQIQCGFCSSKIAASEFSAHIRSTHRSKLDLNYPKECDDRLVFRMRITAEIGCQILPVIRFLNCEHLRCPACQIRIKLHGPYAIESLIRHLKSNLTCMNKLRKESEAKILDQKEKNKPERNAGATSEKKTTERGVARVTRGKSGNMKQTVSSKAVKTNLMAQKKLKKAMKVANQQESPPAPLPKLMAIRPKKEEETSVSKASCNRLRTRIHAEETITKASVLYRYLKNEGSKIFLNRNLGYLKSSMNPKKKRAPKIKSVESFLRKSGIWDEGDPYHSGTPLFRLQLDSPRKSLDSKCCGPIEVEVFAHQFNTKLYMEAKQGRPSGTMISLGNLKFPIRWAEAAEQSRSVDLPEHLFKPLNGHIEWSSWLFFRVTVTKESSSVRAGGRKLRRIPERIASLARRESSESEEEPPAKRMRPSRRSVSNSSEDTSSSNEAEEEKIIYFGHQLLHCGGGKSLECTDTLIDFLGEVAEVTLIKAENPDTDGGSMLRMMKKTMKTEPFSDEDSPTLDITLRLEQKGLIQQRRKSMEFVAVKTEPLDFTERKEDGFPIPLRLIYRFLMSRVKTGMEEEGYSTEADSPDSCPWCCALFTDLYCLLKHLRCVHSRFDFVYKPGASAEELPTVDVYINLNFDGCYEGHPIRQYMLRRPEEPINSGLSSELFIWRRRKSERRTGIKDRTLAEFFEPEYGVSGRRRGHIRQYFSSKTMQPIRNVAEKEDSETERAPEWFQDNVCRQLEDFSDLNSAEKTYLKLWNFHVFKHQMIADMEFFKFCELFVRERWEQVTENKLVDNFGLHMAHMEYLGLISKQELGALIGQLRTFAPEPDLVDLDTSSPSKRKRLRSISQTE